MQVLFPVASVIVCSVIKVEWNNSSSGNTSSGNTSSGNTGADVNSSNEPASVSAMNRKLDGPIYPDTGHDRTSEYQDVIKDHYNTIRSQTTCEKDWKKVNKELLSNFTYSNLKELLNGVRRNERGAFKINIGFGSMLYDTVYKVYRYYYVSHNHYLFDRAYTISTNHDMTVFLNKILSLDLGEKYYFQRPSSGWVLAGLSNLEIKIMRICVVCLVCWYPTPISCKKTSRSIVCLTRSRISVIPFKASKSGRALWSWRSSTIRRSLRSYRSIFPITKHVDHAQYLLKYRGSSGMLDKYFAIQHVDDNNYEIGTKEVEIDENTDIIVDGVKYDDTTGLWALMVNDPPESSYTQKDLHMYKDLVYRTNVMDHHHNVVLGKVVTRRPKSGCIFFPSSRPLLRMIML